MVQCDPVGERIINEVILDHEILVQFSVLGFEHDPVGICARRRVQNVALDIDILGRVLAAFGPDLDHVLMGCGVGVGSEIMQMIVQDLSVGHGRHVDPVRGNARDVVVGDIRIYAALYNNRFVEVCECVVDDCQVVGVFRADCNA